MAVPDEPGGIDEPGGGIEIVPTEATINYRNQGPLNFTAKAQARRNPDQWIHWLTAFAPATQEPWSSYATRKFNFGEASNTAGENYYVDGIWRLYGESGEISETHPVAITLDDVEVARITAIGQEVSVAVNYVKSQTMRAIRPNGPAGVAVIGQEWTHAYDTSGTAPQITATDDILTVSYTDAWSAPRPGVLTAQARIIGADGEPVATAPYALTLTITSSDDGGGWAS